MDPLSLLRNMVIAGDKPQVDEGKGEVMLQGIRVPLDMETPFKARTNPRESLAR